MKNTQNKAVITLIPNDDNVEVKVDYEPVADKDNKAHQIAAYLFDHLRALESGSGEQ